MSASINFNQQLFIPFNQNSDIIPSLSSGNYKTLRKFDQRFGGLCDLICNRILIDKSLGCGTEENYLKNRITVDKLNEEKIKKSHILDLYSLCSKVIAYLFKIYPDNILSFWDQWRLVNNQKLNAEILNAGLEEIENGTTLKVEVFSRGFFSFEGHSLLVKKISSNEYIFFDPNSGEHRGLSFSSLCGKINEQLSLHNATDVVPLKGEDYIAKLR